MRDPLQGDPGRASRWEGEAPAEPYVPATVKASRQRKLPGVVVGCFTDLVLDGLGDACSAVAEPQGIKVWFSVSAQQEFRPPEGDEWAEFVFGQGAVFPPSRRAAEPQRFSLFVHFSASLREMVSVLRAEFLFHRGAGGPIEGCGDTHRNWHPAMMSANNSQRPNPCNSST